MCSTMRADGRLHRQCLTMTSTKTIDDLAKKKPTGVSQLGGIDPYYTIWKSAWHTARDLFDTESDFPVLRMEVPSNGVDSIIIRPEYERAYEDARSIYTDVALGRKRRVLETPGDPLKFTLEGKQSLLQRCEWVSLAKVGAIRCLCRVEHSRSPSYATPV